MSIFSFFTFQLGTMITVIFKLFIFNELLQSAVFNPYHPSKTLWEVEEIDDYKGEYSEELLPKRNYQKPRKKNSMTANLIDLPHKLDEKRNAKTDQIIFAKNDKFMEISKLLQRLRWKINETTEEYPDDHAGWFGNFKDHSESFREKRVESNEGVPGNPIDFIASSDGIGNATSFGDPNGTTEFYDYDLFSIEFFHEISKINHTKKLMQSMSTKIISSVENITVKSVMGNRKFSKDYNYSFRRILKIVLISLAVYLGIIIPAWCQWGICCCCCRHHLLNPNKRLQEVRQFYNRNKIGKLTGNQNGKVTQTEYVPTEKEKNVYKTLTQELKKLNMVPYLE